MTEQEIWKTSKLCMVKTHHFVDVTKVSSLAKTMNNLFLEKKKIILDIVKFIINILRYDR